MNLYKHLKGLIERRMELSRKREKALLEGHDVSGYDKAIEEIEETLDCFGFRGCTLAELDEKFHVDYTVKRSDIVDGVCYGTRRLKILSAKERSNNKRS